MEELIWVTRDGQMYKVCEMTTSHIMNCIAKIQRSRRGWRREYLERLKIELEIRNLENK